MRTPTLAHLAFPALLAPALLAQTNIYNIDGTTGGFGSATAAVGDLDGDGVPEFAVGAPFTRQSDGRVIVFSGRTTEILYQFEGDPGFGGRLGWSVAPAGDVNGDGVPDVIAGAPTYNLPGEVLNGNVRVYSGADGTVLYDYYGAIGDQLGSSVAGMGDTNSDGFDDFAAGAIENAKPPNQDRGYCNLYSGADGTRLHRFTEWLFGAECGAGLIALGDLNGDGVPDVGVASYLGKPSRGALGAGTLRAYSGADGSRIWSSFAANGNDHYGPSATLIGDIDDDGITEIAIGAYNIFNFRSGTVTVISGADAKVIYRIQATGTSIVFGRSVVGVGDRDGDGYGDFGVCIPNAERKGGTLGVLRLYSGKTGTFLSEIVGQAPGFAVGLGAIDLNGDGVTELLLGTAAYAGGRGRLDVMSLEDIVPYGTACGERGGSLTASNAKVGAVMTVDLNGALPKTTAMLLISGHPDRPTVLTTECTAYVDMPSAAVSRPMRTLPDGSVTARIALPALSNLIGIEITMQGVVPSNHPTGFDLTNGVVARIGS